MSYQNRHFTDLLADVIESEHGDRLDDEDLQRAINTAYGVYKMRTGDGVLSAGQEGQERYLREKFGVEYDDVAETAKGLRATDETPEDRDGTSADLSDADLVTDEELTLLSDMKRKAGDLHDIDPSEFALVPREYSDLLRRIREADEVDPDDLALAPKADVSDTVDEKAAIRESLAQSRGVDPEELSDLSLASLRALSDSQGDAGGRPAPRSKAVNKTDVARSDRAEYEDLQETREFLADKSGPLAESRIKEIDERMAELERGS